MTMVVVVVVIVVVLVVPKCVLSLRRGEISRPGETEVVTVLTH